MKEIRILITSVGGLVSPGMIKSLQREGIKHKEKIFIIGADAQKDAVGYHFVDKYYIVPSGESKEYIDVIKEIAIKNNIDVLIPCSDEELLSISKEKDSFIENKIHPICSDYETVSKANDKGLMLEFLEKMKVPTPTFFIPRNINDVEHAAKKLNYPKTSFIIKPRLGRGGRGFKIIKNKIDLIDTQAIKLEYLIDILGNYQTFPDIVLMEYLPGDDYSVDALANNGEPIYVIPRKRIKALSGPSIVGEIIQNDDVKNMVKKIITTFGFHLNVNIQLRYSTQGVPLVYEINPRVSGTIAANAASGVNLLYYGIKLAMNQDIPVDRHSHNVKMFRYFEEIYS